MERIYSLRQLSRMSHCTARWLQILAERKELGAYWGLMRMLSGAEAAALIDAVRHAHQRGPYRHLPNVTWFRQLEILAQNLRSGQVAGAHEETTEKRKRGKKGGPEKYVIKGGQRVYKTAQ